MELQKTEAKSVEERRKEITESNDEYLKVLKYYEFESFPEVKPHKGTPSNIRFFSDGLEFLVSITDSDRFVGDKLCAENKSPINARFTYQLIDESRKKILEYSIDGPRED